ncbi:hypothetical protein BDZ94DRAFT_1260125 [Collybia nuda]|uniref:Uncharacterized protein n=1 Tax=Collybia nuda TaxID=64659 RepID=A0A9P5Y637_9AGAR|nr:hypothetical protein BDZ94DRAFT_1260125 [Collybia nuda]
MERKRIISCALVLGTKLSAPLGDKSMVAACRQGTSSMVYTCRMVVSASEGLVTSANLDRRFTKSSVGQLKKKIFLHM